MATHTDSKRTDEAKARAQHLRQLRQERTAAVTRDRHAFTHYLRTGH